MLEEAMTWKEFTMEEQTSSEHPLVPFWMKISLVAAFCSFFAIVGIWRHGLKSWDWVIFVVFLGIFSFPAGVTEPLSRNRAWPLRAVFVLWVLACSAWLVHF